jgi:hypothetical protein
MDKRIKLLNRLKMQLSGYVYTGHRRKQGWKGPLPFYTFKCPIHGIVENYPQGFAGKLFCPKCSEESIREAKLRTIKEAGVPPLPGREKGEAPQGSRRE